MYNPQSISLKTINTYQFGEYKVFFKVYEKDFSLPTEKEKQRNWDLFLVSSFSPGQPLFPTYFRKGLSNLLLEFQLK